MKSRVLAPIVAALAAFVLLVPLAFAGASISASASASVNVKLAPDPGGLFLVGRPPVPVVRPHRITLGVMSAGVYRTRVIGLSASRVVYVGARARPFVLVGAPVAVVAAPGAAVVAPGAAVVAPGAAVVGAPGVVVGGPQVVVAGPKVVVGASPVVVVGGKHDNGRHKGHHKGRR